MISFSFRMCVARVVVLQGVAASNANNSLPKSACICKEQTNKWAHNAHNVYIVSWLFWKASPNIHTILQKHTPSCARPPQPPRAARAIAWHLFDFFRDVSRKTILFEIIFGRRSVRNGLKTRCFRWSCHEKIKKALHRSVTRVIFAVKTEGKCSIWNSSPDPGNPLQSRQSTTIQRIRRIRCQQPLLGPSPTRAGGQDDVS